ncbi:MAG: SDR family oxidoreductase [Gammaproteobacteria bacterium]
MDLKLQDKIILIAAASQGIGYGIAEAAAREGARLSLCSRSPEKIEQAAASLKDRYRVDARGYPCDAMDAAAIESWIESSLMDFSGVDGLVVNAGGPPPGSFDKFGDADWTRAFNLTLMSAVRMIRGVLPAMRQQKSGAILTLTSSSIKEPIENLLLSNVFRSGVVSLVKTLSYEIADDGIRINNLVPGRIDTERVQTVDKLNADRKGISVEEQRKQQWSTIPLGRYGSIQDMGNAGVFLLSDAAAYITGATLVVDGGKTRAVF